MEVHVGIRVSTLSSLQYGGDKVLWTGSIECGDWEIVPGAVVKVGIKRNHPEGWEERYNPDCDINKEIAARSAVFREADGSVRERRPRRSRWC